MAESRSRGMAESAVVDALVASPGQVAGLLAAEIPVVISELAGRRRAVDAALVEVTGEALRRDEESSAPDALARAAGFSSLAELLQHLLGVEMRDARMLVELAEATRSGRSLTGEPLLPARPAVAGALATARVSVAQAFMIVKGVKAAAVRAEPAHVDAAETELVASAQGATPVSADPDGIDEGADLQAAVPATPEELRVQASAWVAFLDPDGAEPRAEAIARKRGLWVRQAADGTVRGRFVATPEQGELLVKTLETLTSPRRTVACERTGTPGLGEATAGDDRGEPEEAGAGGLDADDGQDGGLDAAEVDLAHPDERITDRRTLPQQRVDALGEVFARYAESAHAPRAGGEAPTVVIVTTLAGANGEATRPADVPHLERTGTAVPPSLVAKTLCDGFVQTAIVGGNGEILKLGRRQRLYSRGQRRALAVRDQGCITPGCWKPVGMCEAHHTSRWVDGGLTDTDDGVLLCSLHHHMAHSEELELVRDHGKRWRVLRPGWQYRLLTRKRYREVKSRC
ncbi:HNH endonuclease signature motif containing protein [Pseudoclavibacter terrae]|uniref:DUF222 domain-containing protein n=1 Tax=Pseudoclavibacter terrae TaxID=1530195 RepID=A0A7J5AYB1_9MICO|nr:HNH endonuclease signature motif containing protein [Pseudoclavibacter terrae]KAB1636475.1 DUF222 domain-containing protein [Pseudoclavibacter terrae]